MGVVVYVAFMPMIVFYVSYVTRAETFTHKILDYSFLLHKTCCCCSRKYTMFISSKSSITGAHRVVKSTQKSNLSKREVKVTHTTSTLVKVFYLILNVLKYQKYIIRIFTCMYVLYTGGRLTISLADYRIRSDC